MYELMLNNGKYFFGLKYVITIELR
jgi:hypothetical protein